MPGWLSTPTIRETTTVTTYDLGQTHAPSKKPSLRSILVGEQLVPHLARGIIEERLRNAILDGRLPCGMAVRQQELATLFGVSRMPVREALRQLEAQGLVVVVQHKGAVVAPLVVGEAVETYALRSLLESEALRQSIPLLDASDYDQAAQAIEQMEAATEFAEIGRLNREFHMALYAKTTNKRLLRLVEQGLVEEERFVRFNLVKMGLGKASQDDHIALLEAARSADVPRSIELLCAHLQRAVDAIERYLRETATG